MSNSNWLSVFTRDFSAPDPCVENLYGVCFDGVSSYAINSSGILGPDTSGGTTRKMWVSVWVKDMSTAATDVGETIFSQGISGNTSNDWFRMTYRPQASGGAPRNQIELEWRANGTTNRAREFYRLYSSNASITGATSDTDYWIDGNSNINTNADGFVHLLWIMDLPKVGDTINTGTTDFAFYWNGQAMTATHAVNMVGTSQVTNISAADLGIGRDAAQGGAYWKGMGDELFVISKDQSAPFMTEYGLTTNQDIADYLWNTGCPGDLGNDSRWNFNWWRFENNWNARSGTNAWNPINSPSFGSFPNGCSFSQAAISCTENLYLADFYHANQIQVASNSSADVYARISNNPNSWDSYVGSINGLMTWQVIGASFINSGNTIKTSTGDIYQGSDYWVRMKVLDGDGNSQAIPSVAGGTSNPNTVTFDEKDPTTGQLTGNSVTFQCIADGISITTSGVAQFIFKARAISQTGFGFSSPGYVFYPPVSSTGNTQGTFCTEWTSNTPIYIISAENFYTTDFNY